MSDFEARTRRLAIVAGLTDSARQGVGGPGLAPETAADFGNQSSLLDTRLSLLEKQFSRRSAQIASTPTVWPVRGAVSSGYGLRSDPFTGGSSSHEGIDISTSRGEPVLATADGTVLLSGWAGEYGRAIEIVHNDRYVTLYGHLQETLVEQGQVIRRGDRVGLVGSTGPLDRAASPLRGPRRRPAGQPAGVHTRRPVNLTRTLPSSPLPPRPRVIPPLSKPGNPK